MNDDGLTAIIKRENTAIKSRDRTQRLTDARKWASSTESAIREGRYFKTNESRKHTLADMVDRYIRDISPLKRTGKKQESQLMWWKEKIGPYALADVTPAMIAECRDRLLSSPQRKGVKKLSGPTVNRYLAALSHAFSVCVKEWGWLEDSPMRRVKKFKEHRGVVRFLSEEERHRFLTECRASPNKALYPVVVLGIATGMRRSEIMYLYWREPKIPPSGAWGSAVEWEWLIRGVDWHRVTATPSSDWMP